MALAAPLLALFPACASPAVHEAPSQANPMAGTPADIAQRFHKLAFDTVREGDWSQEISKLFAEDAVFLDPTTAEFGPGLATGIQGRDNIIATMASFGLKDHAMDVSTSFASGEHAVLFGEFSYAAPPAFTGADHTVQAACPFTVILHVRDGLIAERRDYADYWELARSTNRQIPGADVTANDAKEVALRKQAEEYLAHYSACDWDALQGLWHPEVTFQDPTGAAFGMGQIYEGGGAIRTHFEQVLTTIKDHGGMQMAPIQSFVTGAQAVYLQRITWPALASQLGLANTDPNTAMPLSADILIVLEFKDGKVVRHRDYGDYEPVNDQIRSFQEADAKK